MRYGIEYVLHQTGMKKADLARLAQVQPQAIQGWGQQEPTLQVPYERALLIKQAHPNLDISRINPTAYPSWLFD